MLTSVEEIESTILKLSPQELGKLAEWVLDLDEQNWDKQIERDVATGKLDFLAKEALAELESGESGSGKIVGWALPTGHFEPNH